jgi:hypothetical protein
MGLALFGAACGDGVTPEITGLHFDGQSPDSELVLLFTAEFVDEDGDLGEGFLETFVNGRPSGLGELDLRTWFLWSDVPLNATRGEIGFALELVLPEAPEAGTQFEFGARAVDGGGHVSDMRTVRLQVDPR